MYTALDGAERITAEPTVPSTLQYPGKRGSGQIGKGGGKTGSRGEGGHLQRSKNHRVSQGEQHPSYNSEDYFYQLSREDQVIMMHLRTGHCRLGHHLPTKLHIGDTDMCPCGMTVEYLLQDCTTHQNERKAT